MHYSAEQIERANSTDLAAFLQRKGEQLVRSGSEYRWKAHDSLTVKGNKWFRHSQNKGGYPIDFVMEFYGTTFREAVKQLIDEDGTEKTIVYHEPAPDFRLPARNITNANVIKYLTECRGLSEEVVTAFIDIGTLYEEAGHHNVVFVGKDRRAFPAMPTAEEQTRRRSTVSM